jgi:hypothetical protein
MIWVLEVSWIWEDFKKKQINNKNILKNNRNNSVDVVKYTIYKQNKHKIDGTNY